MKFRFAELLAVSGRLLAERRASGGRCTQQRMKVIQTHIRLQVISIVLNSSRLVMLRRRHVFEGYVPLTQQSTYLLYFILEFQINLSLRGHQMCRITPIRNAAYYTFECFDFLNSNLLTSHNLCIFLLVIKSCSQNYIILHIAFGMTEYQNLNL